MFSRSSSRSPLAAVLAAGVALSFALGAALVISVVGAAPASAHTALVTITPAANARLTDPPTQVVMVFNEPVSTTFVTVVVTNAAGVSVVKGKARVQGATVTQALSPDLASGAYRIAFRVISDDGHPVTGASTFTLALVPGTSPTPSATDPTTSAGTPSAAPTDPVTKKPPAENNDPVQESWAALLLVPIAGIFGLLVIGAAALLSHRRRR